MEDGDAGDDGSPVVVGVVGVVGVAVVGVVVPVAGVALAGVAGVAAAGAAGAAGVAGLEAATGGGGASKAGGAGGGGTGGEAVALLELLLELQPPPGIWQVEPVGHTPAVSKHYGDASVGNNGSLQWPLGGQYHAWIVPTAWDFYHGRMKAVLLQQGQVYCRGHLCTVL